MPVGLPRTNLVYFPVPKVACTSVKRAILATRDPELEARLPVKGKNGRMITAHRMMPTKDFRQYMRLQYLGRRWFCIVRDPIKRFLSGYSNRIRHHGDAWRIPKAILEEHGISNKPDLEEFVERFEDYMRVDTYTNHHFQPAVTFLGARPASYDRIFTIPQIPELEAYCAEAGLAIKVPHRQAGGRKIDVSELTRPMRDKLETYYARDLKIYGRWMA